MGYKCAIYAYRKGGVNLSESNLGDNKVIFHNYGYGESTISLAYGYSLL